MLIKQLFMALLGISFGMAVAGGAFAAIVGVGIIPRFADRTHTAHRIGWYEDSAAIGGILGNIVSVYSIGLFGGKLFLSLFGLFAGMFIGCMAIALAEILNVIPIVARRARLKKGLNLIVLGMAVGKLIGSFIYFYMRW